jgi:hypothetical protein
MKATTRPLLACLLAGVVGCHQPGASPSQLKSTYEDFELKARWGEAAAASQLIVPERQGAFLAARTKEGSTLSIVDIELQNVVIAADGQRATVTSKWRWLLLPSTSEQVQDATSIWVVRNDAWMLESMQGGPYPDLAPRR